MNFSSDSPRIQSRTYVIAFWFLMAVAALQVVGLVWKVVPAMIIRVATEPAAPVELGITEAYRPGAATPPAPAESPAEAPTPAPAAAPTPDPMRMQEAMTFVAQADRQARVGDWENVLVSVDKAIEIMGPNPRLYLQRAFALERLGRELESVSMLNQILLMPDLDPETRNETVRLRNRVNQTIENLQASGIPLQQPPELAGATGVNAVPDRVPMAGPVLDAVGLQPGANLGIVEVREIDGDGKKRLRIAIKSRPNTPISASDVKVTVRFFEKGPEGDIYLTQSRVTSEWISPPVDWADNEPEILDVVYPLPDKESPNSYHGYTVAIYHRDELQDTRAVPGNLDQQFPADLFLESTTP